MSPRTQLVKIAAAALAGATALGGGVALAALTDKPDEADVSQVERAGALPLDQGAVEDVLPVAGGEDAEKEVDGTLEDAEKKAKEAGKNAEEATDEEEGQDGEDGNIGQRPANHGQVVSNVARTTPPGPGHGKAVSAVARTNGKSVAGDGQGDDDTDDVEDQADRADQGGDGGRSGRGRGHGGKQG